jgi:hypothetical protein
MPVTIDPIGAIGPAQNSDWKLEPLAHARELPPAAGALARVLERPDNAALMERFIAADREAIKTQASYLSWSGGAFLCRFLSIVCGTVALLDIAGLLPAGVANLGLSFQYGFIAASLVIGLMLSVREPFERWMRERAAAENARLDLFSKITSATEPERPGELPLLPLQLEYFRRFMLDAQRRYYRKRGLEHARSAGGTKQWQYTVMGLTVLALFVAALGFLGTFTGVALPGVLRALADAAVSDRGQLVMLAGGIVASALGDLTAALSLASLDKRNAARYLSNADNLDFLSEKDLAEARAAAAAGDRGQTQSFIDLVQGIISSEHREWTQLRDLAKDLTLERFAKMRVPGLKR